MKKIFFVLFTVITLFQVTIARAQVVDYIRPTELQNLIDTVVLMLKQKTELKNSYKIDPETLDTIVKFSMIYGIENMQLELVQYKRNFFLPLSDYFEWSCHSHISISTYDADKKTTKFVEDRIPHFVKVEKGIRSCDNELYKDGSRYDVNGGNIKFTDSGSRRFRVSLKKGYKKRTFQENFICKKVTRPWLHKKLEGELRQALLIFKDALMLDKVKQ